jgi:glycosyltransferase involved in cell wall biosynthesis
LTRRHTSSIPAAVYFHENQISYPWPDTDRDKHRGRDRHYGFINFLSALAADAVLFNSEYHRESFLHELPRFLSHFPDFNEQEAVELIRMKSEVLPLGLDLMRLSLSSEDETGSDPMETPGRLRRPPLVLWNHRWEQDKNPREFFAALKVLAERRIEFEVAILGERFRRSPEEFLEARRSLHPRVIQFGYVSDSREYSAWLRRADVLPVTSHQDFFGAAVAEAIYCGCRPLLPRRLAYPSLISPDRYPECYYDGFQQLVDKLEEALTSADRGPGGSYVHLMDRYDWRRMAPHYDRRLASLVPSE